MMEISGMPTTNGLVGLWLSNYYDNTTGTWTDVSGNGNNLIQPTAGLRPGKTANGRPNFQSDFVYNDSLASLIGTGDFVFFSSGFKDVGTSTAYRFHAASSTQSSPFIADFFLANSAGNNGAVFQNASGSFIEVSSGSRPGVEWWVRAIGRTGGRIFNCSQEPFTTTVAIDTTYYSSLDTLGNLPLDRFTIGAARNVSVPNGASFHNGVITVVGLLTGTHNEQTIRDLVYWAGSFSRYGASF